MLQNGATKVNKRTREGEKGRTWRGRKGSGPEFKAKNSLKKYFFVAVKIMISGNQTLECFIATLPDSQAVNCTQMRLAAADLKREL